MTKFAIFFNTVLLCIALAYPVKAQQHPIMSLQELSRVSVHLDWRDRGSIRVVQRSLQAHGLYRGAIDGILGPLTQDGLRLAGQFSRPWVVPVIHQNVHYSGANAATVLASHATAAAYNNYISPLFAPLAPWFFPQVALRKY